jgi:hypothetical protein
MSAKSNERDDEVALLRKQLRAGMTIYTCLRSVSSSGMSRTLDLYYVENGEIFRITWSAAKVLEWTYDRRKEALRVHGCGMDMGFHTVHTLSYHLFGNSRALQHRWL